jgi:putative transposase
MHDWESMSHVKWECKYHVVFIPKYRRKILYGKLRAKIGSLLRDLCKQKGVELLKGNARPDHIHLFLSVPPRYSIAFVIGFLKGKSAIRIHRDLLHETGRRYPMRFWARGYCVSTVGLDEAQVRQYIENQDKLDRDQDHFDFDQ